MFQSPSAPKCTSWLHCLTKLQRVVSEQWTAVQLVDKSLLIWNFNKSSSPCWRKSPLFVVVSLWAILIQTQVIKRTGQDGPAVDSVFQSMACLEISSQNCIPIRYFVHDYVIIVRSWHPSDMRLAGSQSQSVDVVKKMKIAASIGILVGQLLTCRVFTIIACSGHVRCGLEGSKGRERKQGNAEQL